MNYILRYLYAHHIQTDSVKDDGLRWEASEFVFQAEDHADAISRAETFLSEQQTDRRGKLPDRQGISLISIAKTWGHHRNLRLYH